MFGHSTSRASGALTWVLRGMTDEENLENTAQWSDDDEELFDVYLPFSPATSGERATHVARMRGNETAFVDVLAGFVATGSDLSEPLRSPAAAGLDQIKFALDGLGPAHVESIEEL
jgi:hypothetical protein